MSVFVQNIVDMIVDYALWVAVLKKAVSVAVSVASVGYLPRRFAAR